MFSSRSLPTAALLTSALACAVFPGPAALAQKKIAGAVIPATFFAVAAGDATSSEATLWTRATTSPLAPVSLSVQVATDSGFASIVGTFSATADAPTDYTAKVTATGLQPGSRYYYRFVATGSAAGTSGTGTFRTAPTPDANYPLHFAFSGDCDGLIRPYALASQVAAKGLDFFMFDGDTQYETSASLGSPAVTSTGNLPDPNVTTPSATAAQLFGDFSRKYREQFLPVNAGGQNCLQPFFAGQGNYTAYDNHELGNKQYINGGAPAGGPVGSTTGSAPFDFNTGAGVDARVSANDVNVSGAFMNKTGGFLTMQQVFLSYQPVKDRGTISAPTDANTNGTKQLYFAQQWGRNAIFISTDCRSYRDIRSKTAANADETGARADNPSRTLLGATQLAWLTQTLLSAQQAGTTWKFVNLSDPIDQIGPIGGALALQNAPTAAEYGPLGTVTSVTTSGSITASRTVTLTVPPVGVVAGQPVAGAGVTGGTTISAINSNGTITLSVNATIASGTVLTLSPAVSTYAPVSSDGGKSWIGGYRAERNALLKFIADNGITNVVFLATDDHQNRINEVLYSPSGRTGPGSSGFAQTDYVKVPYCFSIVCGPLGATGPDLISNHTFALTKKLADSIAAAQTAAGVEPIGLAGYPGLHDVTRLGDPQADALRQPADFYSGDTFNYNVLDLSPNGTTLTVTSYGINSTVQNSFLEYDAANNPERVLFSFQVNGVQPVNPFVATTRSGFVRDRRTGTYAQQVTLTNTTTNVLSAPFYVVLDGLSANASLVGATGTTTNYPPLGSPAVGVSAASGGLAPGASASITLQFNNPTNAAISYSARVVQGAVAP